MSNQQLIDGLIAAYRTLNNEVRHTGEDALSSTMIRDAIRRMRDDELRFSQALKERISGVTMPDLFAVDELPTLGTETESDSTATLIAQFGTARESTLAMLRGLADADWDESSEGDKSIRARVSELLENDRRRMERVMSMIGAGAAR